jgi:hypothetical protein
MRLGKMRREKMTNKEIGVNFEIMKDDDTEVYLGDVIGNTVGNDERFGEVLEKTEKLGEKWNKEMIGVYGRAIVANTLMLSKLKHRGDVNALNQAIKNKILEVVKGFIWKGKRETAKGEVGSDGTEGRGWRNRGKRPDMRPRCFKSTHTDPLDNERPTTMDEMDRMEAHTSGEEVGSGRGDGGKSDKEELKEDCVVESTLKLWLEIGGTKRKAEEEKRKEEKVNKEKKEEIE